MYGYYSDDDDNDNDNVSVIDPTRRPKKSNKSDVKVCMLPHEQNAFISDDDEDNEEEEDNDLYDLTLRRGYHIEGKPRKESTPSNDGYRQTKFTYDSDDDNDEVDASHYRKITSPDQKVTSRPSYNNKMPADKGTVSKQQPQQQPQQQANDKSNRFLITVVSKKPRNTEKPHPWEHRITDTDVCFAVNGIRGKTIFLRRSNTYYFEIKQKADKNGNLNQYLYFTTDPMGGIAGDHSDNPSYDPSPMEGAPDPTANGVICLKVTSKTPKLFYYQSKTYQMLGGPIVVKD